MAKNTGSVLADHYKALGREEKAHAIRTWLNAVGASLRTDYDTLKEKVAKGEVQYRDELAETRGAMSIIKVLLDRMNEVPHSGLDNL